MTTRRIETGLAYASIAALAIYAPVETIYSWAGGLLDPYYLIDVVAMVLIATGIVRSLRARPAGSPALLAVAWAWASANFWRATFDRVALAHRGSPLRAGSLELNYAIGQLVVALVLLAIAITLVVRSPLK